MERTLVEAREGAGGDVTEAEGVRADGYGGFEWGGRGVDDGVDMLPEASGS